MTDYLADTGVVGEHYCPTCSPESDEQAIKIGSVLTPRYCSAHEPDRSGIQDAAAGEGAPRTGSSEAEGADCVATAKLLRRSEIERVVGRALIDAADHLIALSKTPAAARLGIAEGIAQALRETGQELA